MKNAIATFLVAASLASSVCAAQDHPTAPAPMQDKERIDYLIKQNQMLLEENIKLKGQCERPSTKEEAFASCMQAAKGGTSAMAAESIGSHCAQLLKK
jgi:hypothetical protein